MFIEYTARRSLRPGINPGDLLTLEIAIKQQDRKSKSQHKTQTALSGQQQTVFHRLDIEHALQTIPIDDSALQTQMVEFLESVQAGESYTIDLYGTEATPSDPFSAVLSTGSYTASRIENVFMQYKFTARET